MPSDALTRTLGAAIRAERAGAGMTQADLAAVLAVSRPVLSDIEHGKRELTTRELAAVCAALGVTLDQLLRDAEPADRQALGLPDRPAPR